MKWVRAKNKMEAGYSALSTEVTIGAERACTFLLLVKFLILTLRCEVSFLYSEVGEGS